MLHPISEPICTGTHGCQMESDGTPCAPIASHSIPQCTPAIPVSAGPTGRGRTWDGMVAAWYGMGAHGRVWALMGAVMGTVLSQSATQRALGFSRLQLNSSTADSCLMASAPLRQVVAGAPPQLHIAARQATNTCNSVQVSPCHLIAQSVKSLLGDSADTWRGQNSLAGA